MEVITKGWPEDGKDEVLLDTITCVYLQEPDCTESRDNDPQEITLSTRDGGGGKFLNIKTGESGWSVSSGEDLMKLIEDFSKRVGDESIVHS